MKKTTLITIEKQISNIKSIKYNLVLSENTDRKCYSIEVGSNGDTEYAEDICENRERAEQFLRELAENGVEPCHLLDIVYDMSPI